MPPSRWSVARCAVYVSRRCAMRDAWIDEHVGNEVRPRDGFEAELDGMLCAAWQGDVVMRPSTPGVVGRRSPRHTARVVGWAAAAVVLVAGAVAFVVVERDRDTDPAAPPIVETVAT